MTTIYRQNVLKFGMAGIFFAAGGVWFLSASVNPASWTLPVRALGFLCLVLAIGGCLALFLSRTEVSEEGIAQTGFKRRDALRWQDIKHAYLSGDPDTPWTRSTLYLESGAGQIIIIGFSGFLKPYDFLREILARLPNNCQVDPDLIGFVKEGRKYSWKLFVRTDLRAILIGVPIILILLWIFLSGIWERW